MSDDLFHVNGINGASGGYLMDPAPSKTFAEAALGEALSPEQVDALSVKWTNMASFAPAEGIDPKDLAQSGWEIGRAHV